MDYTMQTAQGQNHGLYHVGNTGTKSRNAHAAQGQKSELPSNAGLKSRTTQAAHGQNPGLPRQRRAKVVGKART